MARLISCLVLFTVLAILIIGCGEERTPGILQPTGVGVPSISAKITIPPGSTFESATLYIYVTESSNRVIAVRRITEPWEELVVTWNNFGGAYAPDPFGYFWAGSVGWYAVDVSDLIEGWLNETYDNYGLLLLQYSGLYPRTAYDSREAAHIPYLEICYTTASGSECNQVPADGDAYIAEFMPNVNTGLSEVLYTGYYDGVCDVGYLSLLGFDRGPGVEPPLAAIGDTVWLDEDRDGIQDAGEPGFPGVTVNLYDCSGPDVLVATTVTDANGYYLFSDLLPGYYRVEFIAPGGYVFTLQNQGADDAVDSDADPLTGLADCTLLDPNEEDMTWDAGLHEEIEYGECEGKVTQLTVRYDGSIVDAHIVVKQKKNIVVFDGIVQPGEEFTFYGADNKGTFGPETYYYVNDVYNTNIHTSCSQPIGPGLTSGDFTVIEGYSRGGGLLPPL
jgi:hypothetical protein